MRLSIQKREDVITEEQTGEERTKEKTFAHQEQEVECFVSFNCGHT